jgi:hypothetical protein
MSQTPHSPSLSEAQLATLAEIGEERTANAGDVLYRGSDGHRALWVVPRIGDLQELDSERQKGTA